MTSLKKILSTALLASWLSVAVGGEPTVIQNAMSRPGGMHGDRLTRFSEEYQEDRYRKTLAKLERIPQWRGTTPWILTDFRSPRRPLPNVQDGWNRKGLIGENGVKKKAFFVLRDFYQSKRAQ